MKKRIVFSLMVMMALFITACGNQNKDNVDNNKGTENKVTETQATDNKPVVTENNNTSGNITEEEAKAIALEHAGVKEEDIRRLNINTYSKNRIEVFEVEFYVGNNEFEYYIEIETGEIIGFSLDIEDLNKLPLLSTNDQIIDLEKAFGIAIEKAQVSKEDIRELSIEFENYGRRAIYEIEFEAGRDEFEIVVDATNGEIIKFERDR